MNERLKLSPRKITLIGWTLLSIMPIIGMIVDLIAPSLPAIAADLHIAESVAKNIITCYIIGFAIGNFFTGFLTDALGRQKLIRLALLGFIIVSLLPVMFPNIAAILIARFLQGITTGAAAVILRAIFADILPREKLIPLGTIIGMMWGLGPVFGPMIGGYLQYYFGWKACFYFFAIISCLSFIATLIIVPETHIKRQPLKFSVIKANCFLVISNPIFVALPLIMGITYSLIIAFHSAAPFLIQVVLHRSPVFFGRIALFMGISFLISTFTTRYFIAKFSINKIFFYSLSALLIIVIVALLISYFYNKSIWLFIVTSLIVFYSGGIFYPISMGKGLSMFSHIAGTATAIMYLLNGAVTSLSSFIGSFITVEDITSLLWIYLVLLITCTCIYYGLIYRHMEKDANGIKG